jgi:hypothetical protein
MSVVPPMSAASESRAATSPSSIEPNRLLLADARSSASRTPSAANS